MPAAITMKSCLDDIAFPIVDLPHLNGEGAFLITRPQFICKKQQNIVESSPINCSKMLNFHLQFDTYSTYELVMDGSLMQFVLVEVINSGEAVAVVLYVDLYQRWSHLMAPSEPRLTIGAISIITPVISVSGTDSLCYLRKERADMFARFEGDDLKPLSDAVMMISSR